MSAKPAAVAGFFMRGVSRVRLSTTLGVRFLRRFGIGPDGLGEVGVGHLPIVLAGH